MSVPTDDRPVRLADGTTAHLRPLRPEDRDGVRQLFGQSSDTARYLRFFSPTNVDGAMRLTPPPADDEQHCVLVVETGSEVVGIAQYDVTDDDEVAEVAFMVRDDQQGRGIATLLLEALAERATRRGIRRFRAVYLNRNHRMADVLAHAGFDVRWSREDLGVAAAEFDLVPGAAWVDRHDGRDERAQARSIARLLRPRSIAVVGAGSDERSIGHAIVANVLAGGFTGELHVVNRHAAIVGGHHTVASVLDIDGPVDLAVVAVPAVHVLDVARQCAAKGVWGLVVVSGGFAELQEGAALQRELLDVCRAAGMRLVGPNCVGVANTDPTVAMNATFSPVAPVAGRVGVASQSGGVGIELLSRAHSLDLGVSTFVSLGNKADVSTNDLLQFWSEDDATDVVVLYLESFGNPGKFARIARRLTREKPVVVLKSGRSDAGARGTQSHTAALADPDAAVDALLHHTGVIRVDTLTELFDVASLLAHQPVPAGRRVAVMSNGGGPAIVAADACVAAGLEVPELSSEVQDALRDLAPSGGVRNPVDLIATADGDVFERAARLLLASGEVDALVAMYVAPYVTRADDIAAGIARGAAGSDRTVASCFLGLDERPVVTADGGPARTIPVFRAPEAVAGALVHAARLGEWRRRPVGSVAQLEIDVERVRTNVAHVVAAAGDEGAWASPDVAAALLAGFGVPVVRSESVANAADAVEAAQRIGYPVALKAIAPGLVHKTDVGGVRLDVADDDAVVRAFTAMRDALGTRMTGVEVQRMADSGVELIVGIHHDPVFGPLVLFGAGGFAAELERDSVLLVPPLTDVDIDDAIRSLRISPLLFGYRRTPLVDVPALHDLLARVGRLACDVPEIAELDCNPVIVSTTGAVVVDVKVRLVARPTPPSPFALD
jgi:acyl-CoA synthetase (NDP forming)/RimJ/RimL family protein N-acetyltransferase